MEVRKKVPVMVDVYIEIADEIPEGARFYSTLVEAQTQANGRKIREVKCRTVNEDEGVTTYMVS